MVETNLRTMRGQNLRTNEIWEDTHKDLADIEEAKHYRWRADQNSNISKWDHLTKHNRMVIGHVPKPDEVDSNGEPRTLANSAQNANKMQWTHERRKYPEHIRATTSET